MAGSGRDADEAVVSCELQSGTISVYERYVHIERPSSSMYEEKSIRMDEITGVDYSGGLMSGHIQVEQEGVDLDSHGLLSPPIDENTLFFPRNKRDCARRARDAILERATG